MKHILVPTRSVRDWQDRLADPEKHWKPGYSAWALAHAWEDAAALPSEVAALFRTDPKLGEVEPLLAVPEYEVPLPGGKRPSQSDLFCLCRSAAGLVSVTVEGKVDESFGETLAAWRTDASEGKAERLDFLTRTLGLTRDPPGTVRYQLLHRTASAVIEAKRFHARNAVMVVHHFGYHESPSFDDFAAFVELYGESANQGRLIRLAEPQGIQLSVGWAEGDSRFLQ